MALVVGACAPVPPEDLRARDEAACRGYGFRAGTDAFADCLLKLDLDRRAEFRAQRAEFRAFSEPRIVYRPVFVPRPNP